MSTSSLNDDLADSPAPGKSFPETPLIAEEAPPLRPTLLDFNPATRHMENLDALRIVAMLVIIVTHVTQPFLDARSADASWGGFYRSIFSVNVGLRFGVPCFMMISFFIYWHQLYEKGRTWGELLARRLKRLVPAFLVWSLIYFALHKFLSMVPAWDSSKLNEATGAMGAMSNLNHVDQGPLGALGDNGLNWKSGRVWKEILLYGHAHEHLYYLPVIIWSLLLIPLLKYLWKTPARAWTWIILTLGGWVFLTYGPLFIPNGSEDSVWSRRASHAAVLMGRFRDNFLVGPMLVFPLVGMISAGQRSWREFITHTPTRLWVGLMVFGLALHLVETQLILPYDWHTALSGLKIGRFITAVPLFVLFLRLPLMRDPFPRVSKHAFGLHFMHPIIIIGLTIVEAKLLGYGPLDLWNLASGWTPAMVAGLLAVNLILTFYITFGLCLLVSRVKWLEFLVV